MDITRERFFELSGEYYPTPLDDLDIDVLDALWEGRPDDLEITEELARKALTSSLNVRDLQRAIAKGLRELEEALEAAKQAS